MTSTFRWTACGDAVGVAPCVDGVAADAVGEAAGRADDGAGMDVDVAARPRARAACEGEREQREADTTAR